MSTTPSLPEPDPTAEPVAPSAVGATTEAPSPADITAEITADTPTARPADTPADGPADTPADGPADIPTSGPADIPVAASLPSSPAPGPGPAPSMPSAPHPGPGPTPSMPSAPHPGPAGPAPSSQPYTQLRELNVVRPDDGRWAAGVAAGLARRWNVDPLLVRGAFVALTLLGGLGVLAYGLGWLLLPQADGRIHVEEAGKGRVSAGFFGAAATTLIGLSSTPGWFTGWGYDMSGAPPFLTIAVVGGVIWWAVSRSRRRADPAGPGQSPPGAQPPTNPAYGTFAGYPGATGPASTHPTTPSPASSDPASAAHEPAVGGRDSAEWQTSTTTLFPAPGPTPGPTTGPTGPTTGMATAPGTWSPPVSDPAPPVTGRPPAPPRPPGFSLAFVGAAVVAGAAVLAWDRWAHPITSASAVAAAVALGVLGLGMVTAGVMGRRGGPLTFFAILLTLVGLGNLSPSGDWTRSMPRTWAPTAATAVGDGYGMGAGEATVDLTSPGLIATATAADPVTVPVQLGAGKLRVLVPTGVPVKITVDLGMGHVSSRIDGREFSGNVTETVTSGTGDPRLVVEVNVGVGDIELVSQAPNQSLVGLAPSSSLVGSAPSSSQGATP